MGGYEHVDAVTGAGSGSGVNGAAAQKVLTSWHLSDSVVVGAVSHQPLTVRVLARER
jgi:hypothetical protein